VPQLHIEKTSRIEQGFDAIGPLDADDGIRIPRPLIPPQIDQFVHTTEPVRINMQQSSALQAWMFVDDAEGRTGDVIDAHGLTDRGNECCLAGAEFTAKRDDVAADEQACNHAAETLVRFEIGKINTRPAHWP
tara:strand:- start:407 stop:805 length:399 start_codon:yes stop_codon:yes gene_type:complete